MCKCCGCRALRTIAQLTDEHDLLIELAGEVSRALRSGDLGLAADRTRRIAAVLEPHTAVEQGALFPALAEQFGEQVDDLIDEHRRIDQVLTESRWETPEDPGWPVRLADVLRLLREHMIREQDGLFPIALAVLNTEQWDAVHAMRASAGLLPYRALVST